MRVLMVNSGVIPTPPVYGGGVERHSLQVATELARLGCRVDYVTSVSDPSLIDQRLTVLRLPSFRFTLQASYPQQLVGNFLGGSLAQLETLGRVYQAQYEIVHGNTSASFACSAGAVRRSGGRSVFTVHNVPPDIQLASGSASHTIRRVTYRVFDVRTMNGVDHLIATSPSTEQTLSARFGIPLERITMIPTGVDTDEFVPDNPKLPSIRAKFNLAEPYIVSLGRLVPQKGFDILIRALSGTNLRAVVVGNGPERYHLESLARQLLRPNQLRLLPSVDRTDLPALLAGALICAIPSRAEGLPAAGLEAMSAAMPLVGFDASGVRDLIADGRNGLLVPQDDVAAFRVALTTLAADESACKSMGAVSRSRAVGEFSWKSIGLRTLAMYEKLLAAS